MHGLMYPKTSRGDAQKGDQYGDVELKKVTFTEAGPATPGGHAETGTGNKRYPKGAAISLEKGRLNPQKDSSGTDRYVAGVST